mgnify:CR=1 FL=1
MENNQYFSKNNDNLESKPQIITAKIGDFSFKFMLDNRCTPMILCIYKEERRNYHERSIRQDQRIPHLSL